MTTIADLDVFAKVVALGSMSAAGRDLGLSTAVISKRIRRLEEHLGTRLLQRTTRQITMTEEGKGYYERVVAILASIEEANAFVLGRSTRARGTLRVSAPTSFGRLHIAPHLAGFLAANPDLTVYLELTDSFVDIVGEAFDVAIRIAELDDSSLVARRLAPNNRCLVAAPAYLEKHGTPKTVADLSTHILLAHNADSWRLEGPEGPATVRIHGPLRTNSSEVVRVAALEGIGIALRSTWDIGEDLKSGRLKLVLPGWGGSSRVAIHAVYPTRRFLPQKVRTFIDWLAQSYGPVPYWDRGLALPLPMETID